MSHQPYEVELYVYDLSQGMARTMSPMFLGKTIEAIYHTGIVVYGYEYFFGGGIAAAPPGQTSAGRPYRTVKLGTTHHSQQAFHDFLTQQSPKFTERTYDILKNNCNNFTHVCAQYLLDNGDEVYPQEIISLPQEVLSTPMGQMFAPMLQQMQPNNNSNSSFIPSAGTRLYLPVAQYNDPPPRLALRTPPTTTPSMPTTSTATPPQGTSSASNTSVSDREHIVATGSTPSIPFHDPSQPSPSLSSLFVSTLPPYVPCTDKFAPMYALLKASYRNPLHTGYLSTDDGKHHVLLLERYLPKLKTFAYHYPTMFTPSGITTLGSTVGDHVTPPISATATTTTTTQLIDFSQWPQLGDGDGDDDPHQSTAQSIVTVLISLCKLLLGYNDLASGIGIFGLFTMLLQSIYLPLSSSSSLSSPSSSSSEGGSSSQPTQQIPIAQAVITALRHNHNDIHTHLHTYVLYITPLLTNASVWDTTDAPAKAKALKVIHRNAERSLYLLAAFHIALPLTQHLTDTVSQLFMPFCEDVQDHHMDPNHSEHLRFYPFAMTLLVFVIYGYKFTPLLGSSQGVVLNAQVSDSQTLHQIDATTVEHQHQHQHHQQQQQQSYSSEFRWDISRPLPDEPFIVFIVSLVPQLFAMLPHLSTLEQTAVHGFQHQLSALALIMAGSHDHCTLAASIDLAPTLTVTQILSGLMQNVNMSDNTPQVQSLTRFLADFDILITLGHYDHDAISSGAAGAGDGVA